jgi:hypothetical protein
MTALARWASFPVLQPGPEFRELTQGLAALPRGAITEIIGAAGSGRTAVAQSLIATATGRGEVVAVIDSDNSFDPASAQKAGTELGKVLWASKIGSKINRVAICTTRSRTVGIPSGLNFPLAFGMYTRRTGCGW